MSIEQFVKDNCASFAVCDSKGVSVPDDCKRYCGLYPDLACKAEKQAEGDTIAELEHLHRQDQAKITELNLEVEKLKELNRNALADRDQVSKQLTKVREANEHLAKNCEENDALKAQVNKLLAICDDIDTAGDMFKPEITGYFKYVNQKCKEAQQLRGGGLDEAV